MLAVRCASCLQGFIFIHICIASPGPEGEAHKLILRLLHALHHAPDAISDQTSLQSVQTAGAHEHHDVKCHYVHPRIQSLMHMHKYMRAQRLCSACTGHKVAAMQAPAADSLIAGYKMTDVK